MASHAGVAMRNEKTVCAHSYAGITRIRFEGPDGYTPISAGMRQHPLDCGTTITLFFPVVKR